MNDEIAKSVAEALGGGPVATSADAATEAVAVNGAQTTQAVTPVQVEKEVSPVIQAAVLPQPRIRNFVAVVLRDSGELDVFEAATPEGLQQHLAGLVTRAAAVVVLEGTRVPQRMDRPGPRFWVDDKLYRLYESPDETPPERKAWTSSLI